MSKETNRKVIDTIPPATGQEHNLPAFVRVHTYHPHDREETKLILQRYLLTKIETIINRDEALAVTQALVEHFRIMPKEIATGLPLDEPEGHKDGKIHFIVVYGPARCGKTRHAGILKKHYGAAKVLEADSAYFGRELMGLRAELDENRTVVVLTNASQDELRKYTKRLGAGRDTISTESFRSVIHEIQGNCAHTWGRAPGKSYEKDGVTLNAQDVMVCCDCGAEKDL